MIGNGRCCVFQPFDNGGPFDDRYDDTLKIAIEKAGLEAYRVDRDYEATTPIDKLQEEIRASALCLADISEPEGRPIGPNPNVMYELGYAHASNKQVIIICREGQELPFNIQHRSVYFYKHGSRRDADALEAHLIEKLRALLNSPLVLRNDTQAEPHRRMTTTGIELLMADWGIVGEYTPVIDQLCGYLESNTKGLTASLKFFGEAKKAHKKHLLVKYRLSSVGRVITKTFPEDEAIDLAASESVTGSVSSSATAAVRKQPRLEYIGLAYPRLVHVGKAYDGGIREPVDAAQVRKLQRALTMKFTNSPDDPETSCKAAWVIAQISYYSKDFSHSFRVAYGLWLNSTVAGTSFSIGATQELVLCLEDGEGRFEAIEDLRQNSRTHYERYFNETFVGWFEYLHVRLIDQYTHASFDTFLRMWKDGTTICSSEMQANQFPSSRNRLEIRQSSLELSWNPGETTYIHRYPNPSRQGQMTTQYRVCVKNNSGERITNIKATLTALTPPELPCVPCRLRLMNNILPDEPPIHEFSLNPGESQFIDVMSQDPNGAYFYMWHMVEKIDVRIPANPYVLTISITSKETSPVSKTFEMIQNRELWDMKSL